MTISETFIRKPITTTLVIVVLCVFGFLAYTQLPISSLPNVDYPVMTVSAYYPGADPETMASTVASPLENEFMSINGLQSIISDNNAGRTTITLTFELGNDVDLIAPDIQAAITRAQSSLPSDLPSQPSYSKDNPSDKPIMYLMVYSDTLTDGDVYDYAYRFIGKRLSMIAGVSKVDTYGSKAAIRVKARPDKLASFGLTMADLQAALSSGSLALPGGSMDGLANALSIQPQGQLQKAEDYKNLIVAYKDGAPVHLGDVAYCVDSVENEDVRVKYGVPATKKEYIGATCLPVSRAAGANTVAVAKQIRKTVASLQTELPASIHLDIMYDNSIPIVTSINDVQQTIIIAIFLVVIIIFLFLGRLRETIIPSLVIPIALLGTFIVMKASGFSLNNLSLMAMVLSVGFLVDDAIVVLENTIRHVETGLKPIPAAIISMRELVFTVVSTSVALAIVFVPLVFMAGVVGRNFREFALTVIIAITVSTVLALIFTPVLCSRWLKPSGGKENTVQKIVTKVIGGMTDGYAVLLKVTLKNKWIAIVIWIACILGTGYTFKLLPKDFIPPGDSGAISGAIIMPLGYSSDQCHAFQNQVQDVMMGNTNVANVMTVTCPFTGADKSLGFVVLTLNPEDQRPTIDEVTAQLNRELFPLTGGMVFLNPIPLLSLSAGGESTAMGSKYSYVMRGQNSAELYDTADKLMAAMQQMDGFIGVQTSVKLNMPQLEIHIDRNRAATFGISVYDIENALMASYAQGKTTTFYTENDTYDVILQVVGNKANSPEDLNSLYLRSPKTGENVPLSALATWTETTGPQNVPHSQQLNSATLSFNLRPDIALSAATKQLEDKANELMPPSVSGLLQGEAQEFQEAIASLVILLGVAVFMMYIILGILYESYIHPFTVLTTLPVAAFGGLATVLIFGKTLNLYAYIGLFTLLGIIAKNGIMMVDFAKQYLEEHEGATGFDAIYNSCIVRFRPILMTGLSTIMGTMPIALGMGADGSSRIPMGLIIVGGMLFAQVITLFVTPGIFLYMQWIQEKVLDRNKAAKDDMLGTNEVV